MCLAIPARVVARKGCRATVEVRGHLAEVDSSLVSVGSGEYVIVHAGTIIERLDPEEAEERLRLLADVLFGSAD